MKTKYLYWIAAGLLVFWYFYKRNKPLKQAQSPSGAVGSVGTMQQPDSFWQGWNYQTQATLKATTDTIKSFAKTTQDLTNGITGLFGGASKATGSRTPATSGSGAGQPVTYSSDNSENDYWETFF